MVAAVFGGAIFATVLIMLGLAFLAIHRGYKTVYALAAVLAEIAVVVTALASILK